MNDPASKTMDRAMAETLRRFPERITPAVAATIRHERDPVALQYLPDIRELKIAPEERTDPIGDRAHMPVKGIVHRHPDRLLFKISSVCAVNCRFCFRKTMLGTPEETLDPQEVEQALAYIESAPAVREVILTGGDPLVLSPRRLAGILDAIENMRHIRILRIHTRIPVAAPERVTNQLCAALRRKKPLYMALHVNHAQELSPAAEKALERLHRQGAVLLSQTVLLKNVNDNAAALEELFHRLVELRIKPYYLHHPDMTPGTGHFRMSIETGRQLMKTLRARASGLCLPSYVLDIPGGYGKIPLESAWIRQSGGKTIITDYRGKEHSYP